MKPARRSNLRNIAIVAHVDHGKTTLVDALLRQTGEFKVKTGEAEECVLDSNPLERERGITILAKCTSVPYKDLTINIVDTPGHADFGSEVERILQMVDGVLLLVDAFDGPMPQTKFVLRKSLALGLSPIVVINKVDRPNARPHEALDKTFSLFIDLGASDPQLDFPIVYASGREGWASLQLEKPAPDLTALFEVIVNHVPPPLARADQPFQMLVTMIEASSFIGPMGIGRIVNGRVARGMLATLVKPSGQVIPGKITELQGFYGLSRRKMEEAAAGDIVCVAGLENVQVGDTIAAADHPQPLPPLQIDEPTLTMEFWVNDSPFAGREGEFLTSRHLRARLLKEQESNAGLRVEELPSGAFQVSGRGELHLSILIETMRREGFELAVSRPEVIVKEENGAILEPAEYLILDIEKEYQGTVMDMLGQRGAEMKNMELEGEKNVRLEYLITARALIGFKADLLTRTRGTGIMHHSFHGYVPRQTGPLMERPVGTMIAQSAGRTAAYALENLQERGTLFLGPGVEVYEGMIIGAHSRDNDVVVNPCKEKKLTNMRASGSDEAILLTPPRILTLEQAIEFIEADELVEVTPRSTRLRKKILNESRRKRAAKNSAPR